MSSPGSIIRARLEDCPAFAGQTPAYVSLGANLESRVGSPVQTLHAAMESLVLLSRGPLLVSSVWESTPLDCPPGSPRFFNAVAALLPHEQSPEELLLALQQIENRLGRVRSGVSNAPRTLDLDLLAWGEVARSGALLTLPHPRMHERRFVLEPLLEIAPDFVVPGQGAARDLLTEIAPQGTIRPINSACSL